jgi:hypothetical protein
LNRYRLWIFIGLIALASLACNLPNLFAAAPTEDVEEPFPPMSEPPVVAQETTASPVDPLSAAKSCLNGTWVINNLSSYVIEAIPPELTEEYGLVYKETSGNAILTLAPDGRISLLFDGLIFVFDANVSLFTVPLTVGIDGEVRGEYTLEGDMLTTSEMDTSGLTVTAQALGQDVFDSAQIISLIPLVQPPFNTALYTCIGDTLQLQFPAYPADFPPLVFQRVR